MKLQVRICFALLLAGLSAGIGGCQSGDNAWSGLSDPVPLSAQRWTYNGEPARKVITPHYVLNTTIQDDRVLDESAQVMEGAYHQYLKFVPGLRVSDRRMDCYIFANRVDWERYTVQNTGGAAMIYLKIMRGGYALGDRYVAYYLGNQSTYSVAAHEGWHQFCGRNFKSQLPPFLEEGIATLFEGVSLAGPHGLPQWNFSVNLNRAVKLREAVESRGLWPLDQLITMHAGQVVDSRGEKIDAFYAQNWAFARFLWDGQNHHYRPALQRLLTDTANGITYDPSTAATRPAPYGSRPAPANVKAILEHYMGIPFAQIEREYDAFVNKIAFDQFQAQWQS